MDVLEPAVVAVRGCAVDFDRWVAVDVSPVLNLVVAVDRVVAAEWAVAVGWVAAAGLAVAAAVVAAALEHVVRFDPWRPVAEAAAEAAVGRVDGREGYRELVFDESLLALGGRPIAHPSRVEWVPHRGLD